MPRVLVTGGAGYIGSHTLRHVLAAGDEVIVLDDLSSGHKASLPSGATLVELSLADRAAVAEVLRNVGPDAVIHFAGSIEPAISMTDPRLFWANNVVNGLNLLDAILDTRVIPIVFSSTCAVYGEPVSSPITEDTGTAPTNVYGMTKLTFERILASYDAAYGLRSISLRYFNACGAAPDGSIGADHRHKVHLMTRACLAALDRLDGIEIFGTDYPTPDGTAIRDYIHVDDLASAHVLALRALAQGVPSTAYNVGVGRGFSVHEVLAAVERVTGRPLRQRIAGRRSGDPSQLVADSARVRSELGWAPVYEALDEIVTTAWAWHSTHPDGFED